MTYKMFLDDERYPRDDDFVIVRDFAAAVNYVCKNGFPWFVAFDHDLGDGPTGLHFALWLIERDLDVGDMPADFNFSVHSMNPIGAENIRQTLRSYMDFKNDHR